MSAVVGIDFSTKAIDLVRLDETTNAATWLRVEPPGKSALERLENLPELMPKGSWWDDIYLIGIETPYGRSRGIYSLNRVFGALVVMVSGLPAPLWEITPAEWRKALGLPGNAPKADVREAVWRLGNGAALFTGLTDWDGPPQDALDAYAIAYAAREQNARAVRGLEGAA